VLRKKLLAARNGLCLKLTSSVEEQQECKEKEIVYFCALLTLINLQILTKIKINLCDTLRIGERFVGLRIRYCETMECYIEIAKWVKNAIRLNIFK